MQSYAKQDGPRLLIGNSLIECVFSLDGRLTLLELKDLSSGRVAARQTAQTFAFDRSSVDLAAPGAGRAELLAIEDTEDAYQGQGVRARVKLTAALPGGATLELERQISVYDGAPAVRCVDFYSADRPLAGLLYSDLAAFAIPGAQVPTTVFDYFSCSDQSNWRLRRHDDVKGKATGFLATLGSVFVYREGPVPDCQPYKTDYNLLLAPEAITLLGPGFDRLRPGERRRSNGLVVGLVEDATTLLGLKRYQAARHKPRPDVEGEFFANSWPAFGLDVSEDKFELELDLAADAGLDSVFIDDGWFETFMGDVDRKKFPNGFDALAKQAAAKGIKLGLWMNPLGLDSRDPNGQVWDGAECHDTMLEGNPWNWIARTDDFIPVETHGGGERTYYGMDLMNPGYYAHIRDKVAALCRDHGIHRFKFDLYQLSPYDTLLGDRHQHYERYRELLEELRAIDPQLSISMDITRRNRPTFDFGLDFGRLFMENRGRNLNDHRFYHPYISLRNLWQASQVAPSRRLELEVRPQETDYSVAYTLSTALCCNPLYWGALTELGKERVAEVAAFVKTVKPHKRKLVEGLVIPFGEVPDNGSWSGMLSLAPTGEEGYIVVYRNGAAASTWTTTVPRLEGKTLKLEDVFTLERSEADGSSLRVAVQEEFGFKLLRFSRNN